MNSPPSRKRIDLDALSSNIDSVNAIDPVARPLARLVGEALAACFVFLVTIELTYIMVSALPPQERWQWMRKNQRFSLSAKFHPRSILLDKPITKYFARSDTLHDQHLFYTSIWPKAWSEAGGSLNWRYA